MKNQVEVYRALLAGRTLIMKDKHTPLRQDRFARIVNNTVCVLVNGKYVPMTAQLVAEDWDVVIDDGHFIECEISVSRRSLIPAKVFEQLNADPKSVWKCTLEKVK